MAEGEGKKTIGTSKTRLRKFRRSSEGLEFSASLDCLDFGRDEFKDFLYRKKLPLEQRADWALVFTELVTNAIKHGSEDETMMIKVRWGIERRAGENVLILRVEDEGKGIDKQILSTLDSLPSEVSESGRGLYLVKKCCDGISSWQASGQSNGDGHVIEVWRTCKRLEDEDAMWIELDRAFFDLESSYESLSAFREMCYSLINSASALELLRSCLTNLRLSMANEIDLLSVCLSNEVSESLIEELSFLNEVIKPSESLGHAALTLTSFDNGFYWNDFREIENNLMLRNYQCGCTFPMVAGKKTFGLLAAARRGNEKKFSENEENIMRTAADLLGIALANYTLQSQRDSQQRAIHELEIASRIQKNLLPDVEAPKSRNWRLVMRQAEALDVGGDYYDAKFDSDGNLILTVVDVMGKGVSAAMVASIFRAAFYQNLDKKNISLTQFANNLNDCLYTQLRKMTIFATCALIRASRDGKNLEIVNAGHPPILLFRKGKCFNKIESSGSPLGLFKDKSCDYSSHKFRLKHGDSALVISDGLFEWENTKGDWWGWREFYSYANEELGDKPEIFWRKLKEKILANPKNKNARDDLTMLYWQRS